MFLEWQDIKPKGRYCHVGQRLDEPAGDYHR